MPVNAGRDEKGATTNGAVPANGTTTSAVTTWRGRGRSVRPSYRDVQRVQVGTVNSMSELERNRLLPWLSIWAEIKWSKLHGYTGHAALLQRLIDREWEES